MVHSALPLTSLSRALLSQPLILLEKHRKLWGKGVLLTRLTSRVSGPACLGADALSQVSAAVVSSAEGWYDLPTFLRSSDGSSGGAALCIHWETR